MRARAPFLLLLLAAVGAGACVGPWRRPEKAAGALVWVSAASPPEASALTALEAAGREVVLEVGTLEWREGTPSLAWQRPRAAPRRLPVTLALRGEGPPGEVEAGAAAAALARQVGALRLDAESWGLVPVGVHFDVAAQGRLAAWAQVLDGLRDELGGDLFVSASLERSWLEDPDAGRLADAVDFLVAFLYGQRPGEPEDPAAWDLIGLEAAATRLEELGCRFYVGAVSLGSADHLSRGGGLAATTTRGELSAFARHPGLRLRTGFSLQGGERRVYTFAAEAPATVGGFRLRAGESVRVTGTAGSYLGELRRRLERSPRDGYLGMVYYRLPSPEETLSLPAASLVGLLAGDAPPPALRAALEVVGRLPGGLRLRAVLENLHPEPTELSLLDNNYLELDLTGGVFTDVDPGGFWRFALLEAEAERVTMGGLRAPTRLRLFLPLLEGLERVESGTIEVRGDPRHLELSSSAAFMLPDGTAVELAPSLWRPPD